MANKREGLPPARSVKGLHPVEALVSEPAARPEGAPRTESSASNATTQSNAPAEAPPRTKGAASKERVIRETSKPRVAFAPASVPATSSASTTSTASRASSAPGGEEDDLPQPDAPTVGHYRRSFMLDPATIQLIDELRWKLRCDKSEVVRYAIERLADGLDLPFPDE